MIINLKNKDGVTLKTQNKFCEEDIEVVPNNKDNITPENIKKDVEILGVTGTYESTTTDKLKERITGTLSEYTIPDDIDTITKYTFAYNPITSIKIPLNIKKIDVGSFSYCTSLSNVTIEDSDTQDLIIESNTFVYPKFAEFTLPKRLKTAYWGALNNCTEMKKLTILTTNVSLVNSFISCTNLEEVIVPSGFNASLNISCSTKYTREVLLNIINNYADRTDSTALVFTIGTTNLAKLTDEDKLIATNKNITLA